MTSSYMKIDRDRQKSDTTSRRIRIQSVQISKSPRSKIQLSKTQISRIRISKTRISRIAISKTQISSIGLSNIQISRDRISDSCFKVSNFKDSNFQGRRIKKCNGSLNRTVSSILCFRLAYDSTLKSTEFSIAIYGNCDGTSRSASAHVSVRYSKIVEVSRMFHYN